MLQPSGNYNFDEVVDRHDTSSTKWDHYPQSVLPMWVGDTDFKAAPEILQALTERISHGVLGYTDPPDSLIEIIIERLQTRGNWRIQPDWLVFLPGMVPTLYAACRAFSRPQAPVAIPASIYPPFRTAVTSTGRRVLPVPLAEHNGRQRIVGADFKRSLRPDTELFLFCNPHNPGGAVYSRRELESIAEVCLERNLVLCSDEIHCDLVFEGQHLHIASLSEEIARRTITLLAPSKSFNIAGLACGFAIIPDPTLRQQFTRSCRAIGSAVNLLGYTAAEAAYRHGGRWLEQMVAYLQANRDWLHARLGTLDAVRPLLPQATFFSWIDLREKGIEKIGPHFEGFGLGLSDGAAFGSPGWVRWNFGTRRALLEEGYERFKRALEAAG